MPRSASEVYYDNLTTLDLDDSHTWLELHIIPSGRGKLDFRYAFGASDTVVPLTEHQFLSFTNSLCDLYRDLFKSGLYASGH